jgi:hypothetical protein
MTKGKEKAQIKGLTTVSEAFDLINYSLNNVRLP